MAGDASLSITPVMKWNFERSCYRWLVTRHPSQFERMDFTAQILQSASRARKAFYECGWDEAKVLIRPADGKFERTPFFDTIIRRGLRNSTRFDASTLSMEEVEALGMHRDETLGFKLQIRQFRHRRKEDDTKSDKNHEGTAALALEQRSGSQSRSPTPSSRSPHSYPRAIASGPANRDSLDSYSLGARQSVAGHPRAAASASTDWGPVTSEGRGPGSLVDHPRWGRESVWRPSNSSVTANASGAPPPGVMPWGHHSRLYWRSAGADRGDGRSLGEREPLEPTAAAVVVTAGLAAGPAWQHHARTVGGAGSAETLWEGRCAPRRAWGFEDRKIAPHSWEPSVRVGNGRGTDGRQEHPGGDYVDGANTPSAGVGSRFTHYRSEDDGRMIGRTYRREDCGGNIGSGGRNGVSQPAPTVELTAGFVHREDAAGGRSMGGQHRQNGASEAPVIRNSRVPLDVAETGDGSLLAQGYMRLAAMRELIIDGGGGDASDSGSGSVVAVTRGTRGPRGAGGASPVIPYESERPYALGKADASPSVPTGSPKGEPKGEYTEVPSPAARSTFEGGDVLPPISQAIPDVQKQHTSRTELVRSCSPIEDLARPLKKRRGGSPGSNSKNPANGNTLMNDSGSGAVISIPTDGGERCVEKYAESLACSSERGSNSMSSSSSMADPSCKQLTKELEESERELLSARRALNSARVRFEQLSRAHRAKQQQVMTAAGHTAVEGSRTLRECAGLRSPARSCTATDEEVEGTEENSSKIGATASIVSTADALRSGSFDRSAEHLPSLSKDPSPLPPAEAAAAKSQSTGDACTATTMTDEMLTDVKAEAEILCGMGRTAMSSLSSSKSKSTRASDRSKKQLPETDSLAPAATEEWAITSVTCASRHSEAHVKGGEEALCRKQQQPRQPQTTHSRGESQRGANADRGEGVPNSECSAAAGGAGAARHCVTVGSGYSPTAAHGNGPSSPANTSAAAAHTVRKKTATPNSARVVPPSANTPASPSLSSEADGEHSCTTAAASAVGRGEDRTVENDSFYQKSDSLPRRFHDRFESWAGGGRREGGSKGLGGETKASGYVPPLVQLASVAAAGGRGGYGGVMRREERFHCM